MIEKFKSALLNMNAVNFAIIVLIAIVVIVTKDGMALLALLFLQSPSYEQYEQTNELEPACGPMGFIDHNALADESDDDDEDEEEEEEDEKLKRQNDS